MGHSLLHTKLIEHIIAYNMIYELITLPINRKKLMFFGQLSDMMFSTIPKKTIWSQLVFNMLSKFVIKLAMNLGEGFNDISVIKIFKTSWRSTLKIKQFNLGLILIYPKVYYSVGYSRAFSQQFTWQDNNFISRTICNKLHFSKLQ